MPRTVLVTNVVVEENGKWYIKSHDGKKNLGGPYDTEEQAKDRLKEIKHFKTNTLQLVTTNLSSKVRRDTLEGQEYLVVPMVMLTEGVHNGTDGPLYYPPDELAKFPAIWNQKPVVVYHPTENGVPISACERVVLDTQKVGVIMSTEYKDGKLKAEAWLNENRLREVDARILQAIENDQVLEVSTGLFTENELSEGEWNGEHYAAIARNYRPDHLAILPDQVGACSVLDGAGLLQNSAGPLSVSQTLLNRALSLLNNEMSHGEISQQLMGLVTAKFGVGTGSLGPWYYTHDVYDEFFIYSDGKDFWKQAYTKEGKDVKLVGDPVQVVQEVSWRDKDGNPIGNTGDKEMSRKDRVDKLIANKRSPWSEADRDFLTKATDAQFNNIELTTNQVQKPGDLSAAEEEKWASMTEDEKMAFVESRKKKDTPPATNQVQKPSDLTPAQEEKWAAMTEDEKMAFVESRKKKDTPPATNTTMSAEEYINNAPDGIRDMLSAGMHAHQEQRDKLIGAITANSKNTFSLEELRGKGLKELRAIAAFAEQKPAAQFVGNGDVSDITDNTEQPLVMPSTLD